MNIHSGYWPISFKSYRNYNADMNRRIFQRTVVCLLAAPALLPAGAWAQGDAKVQSLSAALLWLDRLHAAPGINTSGAWPLSAILEHLAQSIEMSMDGFPAPKSELFQRTLGTAAFTVFKWRGQMSHSLAEPIPGAPVLTPAAAWQPAAQRLRASITRFEAHKAALKPHFAYGQLSKSDYALAHTMHIANHQDEIAAHRLA
jgi:Protein of unknown function (DUF1569)